MAVSNCFSGKKILVTGAGGFIGSHLCQRLNDAGFEVHGTFRNPLQTNRDDHIRWSQCDLEDFGTVRNLLTRIKPDVIFHLASHVFGSRNLDLILPTFQSNLVSTVNLLTAATEIGCHRIVMTGSMEEPSQSGPHIVPSSPYAAAKWAGSVYARMFHALYQTPVTIARVFMVYGPGQRDLDKLIPYTILSLLRNQVPKYTSGHRQVDWIFVEDVVSGLLAMAHTSNIEGLTIDLGSGAFTTIKDIVLNLVDIVDSRMEPSFGLIPDRPMEQVRLANLEDSFSKIGWKPQTSLEKGLRQTAEWYRQHLGSGDSI
jgi:nucleoside-diphosphate-sugar epimerase